MRAEHDLRVDFFSNAHARLGEVAKNGVGFQIKARLSRGEVVWQKEHRSEAGVPAFSITSGTTSAHHFISGFQSNEGWGLDNLQGLIQF